MPGDAAPSSIGRQIEDLIARAPIGELERIGRHFSPSALRRRRLDQRDAELRDLARDIAASGRLSDGFSLAQAVKAQVDRYDSTAWPRERDGAEPADPRRARLWRILSLNRGSIPDVPQLMRILAGERSPLTSAGKRNSTTKTATRMSISSR